jgi:4'-phosphopantetheinyl transferase
MTLLVLHLPVQPVAPAQADAWLAALPPARRDQLLAWPDARARQVSLLGSRLLHVALQRTSPAFGLGDLHYPPQAKPRLGAPGSGAPDFSISHSGDILACALSTRGAVGLDLEQVGVARASGMPHYLRPAERRWAGEDPLRFHQLWTRKEAVVKAAGQGGLQSLGHFEALAATVEFGDRRWFLRALDLAPGYVAHLALELGQNEADETTLQALSMDDLLA